MFIKLSSTNLLGASLIELLIYISLLGLLTTLGLSFGVQLQLKSKAILCWQNQLQKCQIALDLMAKDLRSSQGVKFLNQKQQQQIIFDTRNGQIVWQLKQHDLIRINYDQALKKPAVAKVVEQVKMLNLQKIKDRHNLWKIELIDEQGSALIRQVALRSGLLL